ncbi:glutamine-hydrolyzing carbamoyl-phosphate synthase small subunit [Deltaproteobacteria bacterium PRO3]|nr:glutamine-hydrolyzing carbamoyl-phosphate synthase small subunit [Deltaproteobacteria bacterium PRO3]
MLLKKDKAILMLQDGTHFEGYSFGYAGEASGEVVFNTSLIGYQEILTDPSYKGQIVTMTYPMIGNYGVNAVDVESAAPQVEGFIVKEYSRTYSNYRAKESLGDYLKRYKIPGIEGIDTRALVRHIRDKGAQPGLISTTDFDLKSLRKRAKQLPSMEGQDLVREVTCAKPYVWKEGTYSVERGGAAAPAAGLRRKVIAYDFGIKKNILRNLVDAGCDVKVVPATTPAEEVLAEKPDGVFLSNGPGDPAAVSYGIDNAKKLIGKVPLFGICLGHQILGLALGAKTYKLKFGHRGGNQPVKNLQSGQVEITAQNHGFAIDPKSLGKVGQLTHVHLNDNTVSGFSREEDAVMAVQYHPEASPGPHDSLYLFQQFRNMMDSKS